MKKKPKNKKKGAPVRFPPPILFLVMMAMGYYLEHHVYSLGQVLQGRLVGLGWAFIVLALVLMKMAMQKFKDTAQDPKPWLESPELIVEGVYIYTRNPMYVAMALIQLGVGLNLENLWILGLTPISIFFVYGIAVGPEEKYLKKKFGKPYETYLQKVGRWI